MRINATKMSALAAAAAMAAVLGAATVSTANAAEKSVKCYGVNKAGHNDCKTATGSCAGTAKSDRQGDAFVVVPSGTCAKLAGGSLTPKS
ncbi:BufA1 family periplasmic bufferin-type metallophore [Varunaivibrio sulfuroxidans]|uniref:Putative membrane protein n=1 Tax=Varunaivibrio sulfuroxidans TaxID=1773489 RepID=A0A4R3JHX2_9PROT|nr:DUF2282 domain-containing protein [Varunaivibrio sulfuroxidans]TCS64963.1 putative membrane protein [Varunaivibrio sulfuroxidans]WES29745.1 DUF2282 domain-containing protein [Varunaivibrio sulfuroxidans]